MGLPNNLTSAAASTSWFYGCKANFIPLDSLRGEIDKVYLMHPSVLKRCTTFAHIPFHHGYRVLEFQWNNFRFICTPLAGK
jgi:hypothetical protein